MEQDDEKGDYTVTMSYEKWKWGHKWIEWARLVSIVVIEEEVEEKKVYTALHGLIVEGWSLQLALAGG